MLREYVTLLEQVFPVDELLPWHDNRLNSLVKTPKVQSVAEKRFTAGVILYDGQITASFGNAMYAVPLGLLWDSW